MGWSGVPGVVGLSLLLLESDKKGGEVFSNGGERVLGTWLLAVASSRAGGGAMPEKTSTGMRKGRTISWG
jgi:hypothetical protein